MRTACTACCTACFLRVLVLRILWQIFRLAGTRWLQGFTYNDGGLHSILLTSILVVVAAHTPCRGGGGGTSCVRPDAQEGAPQGAQACEALVSQRFAFRFRFTNSRDAQSRCVVVSHCARFGLPIDGVPSPVLW